MQEIIYSLEEQEYYARKWCEKHNVTLISTSELCFCYMLPNGNTYTLSWWEIDL